MRTRTGYGENRATAAALVAQKRKAMAALSALEKNHTDPNLIRAVIAEREKLAYLYRRLTGRELFDRPLQPSADAYRGTES